MKTRIAVCALALFGATVQADASLSSLTGDMTVSPRFDAVPVTDAFAAARGSGVVYSRLNAHGARFNPGVGGNPPGTGLQADVVFDDIPIPIAALGGNTALEVTRVTLGIVRTGTDFAPPSGPGGGAPASDFNLFFSTASTTATAPDTQLDTPPTFVATQSLPERTEAGAIIEAVTFGDGVNPLFTVPLNFTILQSAPGAEDFGTFMLGLQISDTTANARNGWGISTGLSLNAQNIIWLLDSDLANPEISASFGPGAPASFLIEIEGTPVPEPGSLMLLGLGAACVLRRRR